MKMRKTKQDIIIKRVKELVDELLENDISVKIKSIASETTGTSSGRKKKQRLLDEVDLNQMTLFDTDTDEDILNELKTLDINSLTPIEALNTLCSLQSKLNNRWSF